MTLRFYDSMSRSTRPFQPIEVGHASIYLCGLTVQSAPHVGHIRSAVNFDILRRWLEHTGHEVTFIRNVTDIDDKILAKSAEADVPWWAWAYQYEREVTWAYDTLNCLPVTYEPRATGHIPEMVELIERLIAKGHAYPADGDVYFDVRSFPDYGALSGQKIDEMQAAADSAPTGKHDPRDFALWKAMKSSEPHTASWPSPWGRGRPGWHIECSAMAGKYLGAQFDIHAGGLDLAFPHHENEIAQSVAANGAFANYWLHNAWVTTSGEKMSKSLGNSLAVREVVTRWRPVEVRYYLGAAHYRSNIEFSDAALDEAATAYRRIEGFLQRCVERFGTDLGEGVSKLPSTFVDAMNDDLAVPRALAELHGVVSLGNAALNDPFGTGAGTGDGTGFGGGAGEAAKVALDSARQALGMLDVLGLNPADFVGRDSADQSATIDALAQMLLKQRQTARENKDFVTSDSIRDAFALAGLAIEDTPDGPRWLAKEQ